MCVLSANKHAQLFISLLLTSLKGVGPPSIPKIAVSNTEITLKSTTIGSKSRNRPARLRRGTEAAPSVSVSVSPPFPGGGAGTAERSPGTGRAVYGGDGDGDGGGAAGRRLGRSPDAARRGHTLPPRRRPGKKAEGPVGGGVVPAPPLRNGAPSGSGGGTGGVSRTGGGGQGGEKGDGAGGRQRQQRLGRHAFSSRTKFDPNKSGAELKNKQIKNK